MVSVSYMSLGILFCVCLISANVLATKQIQFLGIDLTAGLLVFPISYIVNDCIVEVWGFDRAKFIIWMGFLMNLLFVIFGFMADIIPGAAYWNGDAGFHQIFGLVPRVSAASFLAFLCGSFVNAYVMSIMKVRGGGKNFSNRAILSTIAGEFFDSVIFFPLALGGIVPWSNLMVIIVGEVALKTLYEIIILHVTKRVVNYVKRAEQIDVFDRGLKYRIF